MKRNLIIIAVLLGSLVLCSCTNSAQVNSNISSGSSTDENSSIAESYTVTENLPWCISALQYPVFSHDGNNVRSDTYGNQVEQWNEVMELDAITDGKCLHEFEAYAATGKVLVRIRII